MSFEITDLSSLDSDLVSQLLADHTARIQELHPEIDVKRGVFHDVVLYFHAVLEAAVRENLRKYLSARSLKQILEDPSLADEDIVEHVLSNFRITRQAGSVAYGKVTVIVSDSTTVTVTAGSVWTASGKTFTATQSFVGKTEVALITSETDRLMQQLSDGTYAFQIDVIAESVGEDYKLTKDTKVIPSVQPLNYLTSYASEDFSGGDRRESNEDLLTKLQSGLAASTLSNRVTMRALLRDNPQFAGVSDMSIVGFGDAAMLRDQHSAIPISYGGRVDWYVRSQRDLKKNLLQKTATLVEVRSDGTGVWQLNFDRTESSGFYEVRNIRLSGVSATIEANSFEIMRESRSFDFSGASFIPDIVNGVEACYSPFQTTTVDFYDDVTNVGELTVGATQVYEVETVGMPQLLELQNFLAGRDVRSYAADVLVKAPVPCFVSVNLVVNKKSTDADLDTASITQAIVNSINSVPFIGRLDASRVCKAIAAYLTEDMSVTQVDLFGRLRNPDGSINYLRSHESLEIKDNPELMVTPDTVQFFAEAATVAISVSNSVHIPS